MANQPEQVRYVMNKAKEHDVKFIRLWFTDILGFLKSFAITVDELEGVDGGEGVRRLLDRGLCPDRRERHGGHAGPEHLRDPALAARRRAARWRACSATSCSPTAEPYDGDPRYVLKRALAKAAESGLHLSTSARSWSTSTSRTLA